MNIQYAVEDLMLADPNTLDAVHYWAKFYLIYNNTVMLVTQTKTTENSGKAKDHCGTESSTI